MFTDMKSLRIKRKSQLGKVSQKPSSDYKTNIMGGKSTLNHRNTWKTANFSLYRTNRYKTKNTLITESINFIPWNISKRVKNLYPHKNFIQMFMAALFLIAKTWKPPKYPPVKE